MKEVSFLKKSSGDKPHEWSTAEKVLAGFLITGFLAFWVFTVEPREPYVDPIVTIDGTLKPHFYEQGFTIVYMQPDINIVYFKVVYIVYWNCEDKTGLLNNTLLATFTQEANKRNITTLYYYRGTSGLSEPMLNIFKPPITESCNYWFTYGDTMFKLIVYGPVQSQPSY